eukprot:144929-Chlamydomonas_euryale.AAC.3
MQVPCSESLAARPLPVVRPSLPQQQQQQQQQQNKQQQQQQQQQQQRQPSTLHRDAVCCSLPQSSAACASLVQSTLPSTLPSTLASTPASTLPSPSRDSAGTPAPGRATSGGGGGGRGDGWPGGRMLLRPPGRNAAAAGETQTDPEALPSRPGGGRPCAVKRVGPPAAGHKRTLHERTLHERTLHERTLHKRTLHERAAADADGDAERVDAAKRRAPHAPPQQLAAPVAAPALPSVGRRSPAPAPQQRSLHEPTPAQRQNPGAVAATGVPSGGNLGVALRRAAGGDPCERPAGDAAAGNSAVVCAAPSALETHRPAAPPGRQRGGASLPVPRAHRRVLLSTSGSDKSPTRTAPLAGRPRRRRQRPARLMAGVDPSQALQQVWRRACGASLILHSRRGVKGVCEGVGKEGEGGLLLREI